MRALKTMTNEDARAVLMRLRELHMTMYEEENTDLLELVLATYVSLQLPMDTVWLIVVGPPSSGKTTSLDLLNDYPNVVCCSSLTVASLLSGTPNREKTSASTGGILRQIGEQGLISLKDLSSILSLKAEKQQEIMAAFREIADGSWTRAFGTDGGKSEIWTGKVGVIAASTTVIDQKNQQMALMGERFLFYRMPVDKNRSIRIARRALEGGSTKEANLRQLNKMVKALLDLVDIPNERIELSDEVKELLVGLACLVVRCRAGIDRNGYTRKIEAVHPPEEPARIIKQFETLFCALLLLGNTQQEAWQKVRKVGLSSMPEIRLKAIQTLLDATVPQVTSSIASECNTPPSTIKRALEDLSYQGVVKKAPTGQNTDSWYLPEAVKEELEGISVELTDEEIPVELLDLLGKDDSPEIQQTHTLFIPAHKEGRNRVSPSEGQKGLREGDDDETKGLPEAI